MIERIGQVTNIEWADTKDGTKQYMKVTLKGQDGKEGTQAIFDPAIQKVMTEAHDTKQWVKNQLEKEGKFWNIKSSELLSLEEPPKPPDTQPPDSEYWERKQAIERASIEGQVCLKCLTELTIAGIKLEDCPALLRDALQSKLKGFAGETSIVAPPKPESKLITHDQIKALVKAQVENGYEPHQVTAIIVSEYKKTSSTELTSKEADELIGKLNRREHKS